MIKSVSNSYPFQEQRVKIAKNFEMAFIKASKPLAEKFVLGSIGDNNAGGWMDDEFVKNLSICVEEKSNKIRDYQSKYAHWWLCLVSHIGFASDEKMAQVCAAYSRRAPWHKIIIVDRNDIARKIEFD